MSYFDFENKKIFYTVEGTEKPLLLLRGNTAMLSNAENFVLLLR